VSQTVSDVGIRSENNFAVAALVLAIPGLVATLSLVFIPAALVLVPLAIVCGIVGRRRVSEGAPHGALATAGLIVAAVTVALGVRIVLFVW
jgi:hypothetical protein